jgi:hypothetical protein
MSTNNSLIFGGNTAIGAPVGNTAQRPFGEPGFFRYNKDIQNFEGYTTQWGTLGGGQPSGNNTWVQYNNSGAFGAAANLTYDDSVQVLTVNGEVSAQVIIAKEEILSLGNFSVYSNTPNILQQNPLAGLNTSIWEQTVDSTGNIIFEALNDEQSNINPWLIAQRANGTSNITNVFYGNPNDNPIHTFYGTINATGISGNSTPSGSNTWVQFNNTGIFGSTANLTFNENGNILTVNGLINIGGTVPANTPQMPSGPPVYIGGQLGSVASPNTSNVPLVHFAKYYTGNNAPGLFDGGAAWFSNFHQGGNTYSKALTGYTQIDSGAPNSIAVHGYGLIVANGNTTGAAAWGGWFTVTDLNTTIISQPFGVEIDLQMAVDRPHVTTGIGQNAAVGLWINNQSDYRGNANGTMAIGVTGERNALGGGNTSRWYTGLWFNQNSIVPGPTNEAILINGGDVSGNGYSGLRLSGFQYQGIDLSTANFASGAIYLPNGTANGGYIFAQDSANTSNNYPLIYLNAANPNQVVIGQTVPGGIVLDANTTTPNLSVTTNTYISGNLYVTANTGTNNDFGTVAIRRNADYINGILSVPSALRVDSYIGNTGNGYEWTTTSVMHNSSNTGQQVAIYGQGNKVTSNASATWAGTFEARELVPINDPTTGLVGLEVDNRNNGTDNNGNRVGIDLVIAKYNTAATAANAYVTYGYRLQNNQDPSSNAFVQYAYSVWKANCQYGFDTATSVCISGAYRMAEFQTINFDLTGNNVLYFDGVGLRYDSGPTNSRTLVLRMNTSIVNINSNVSVSGDLQVSGNVNIASQISLQWNVAANSLDFVYI